MRFPFAMVLACVVLFGCAKKEEAAVSAPAEARAKAVESPSRYMAYEHSISLDVEEDRVEVIRKSVEDACLKAVEDQCVVLQSRLNAGRGVSASIKVRAKAEGIGKLISSLGTQGKVVSQSVAAEDLAAPIGDAGKRLEMLNDYRSRLESLRGRAAGDIEALIKVNKELAETQSEIEALTGEHAHLMQRVETEILEVSITSVGEASFWRPIGHAASGFTSNLSEGISTAITSLAYLLPWLVMLSLAWWGGRKLRSRYKKASADA